jgi:hypothetical protein
VGVLKNEMVHLDNQILYPEEAIYMMENQKLIVLLDKVPISIQQAMQITELDLDLYHLYSSLKRAQYLVFRFEPIKLKNGSLKTKEMIPVLETEKPVFDVYKSIKGFKSATRGTPNFQILLCRKNIPNLNTLLLANNSVPLKVAIIEHGNLNYFSLS